MDYWREHVKEIADRLERDCRDRADGVGGGFSAGGNRTEIVVEVLLGGRIGPMWGTSVKYAKRSGLFGPVKQFRDWPEVEAQIRNEIEAWLDKSERQRGGKR